MRLEIRLGMRLGTILACKVHSSPGRVPMEFMVPKRAPAVEGARSMGLLMVAATVTPSKPKESMAHSSVGGNLCPPRPTTPINSRKRLLPPREMVVVVFRTTVMFTSEEKESRVQWHHLLTGFHTEGGGRVYPWDFPRN